MTFFGDRMKICVIGNSKRADVLAGNLKELGHELLTYKTAKEFPPFIDSDIVVLPIPTLLKDGSLNLQGWTKSTPLQTFFSKFNGGASFISCNYTNDSYRFIDINKREDFAYLNAVPTAEGAIHAAITASDRSLFDSRILVTGFGRVGKLLADRLRGMSRDVTVAARSLKDISYAQALGLKTEDIGGLKAGISRYDLIFQTVPCMILNEQLLSNMNRNCIIIELSSGSVGTDCESAEKYGIKVVHAPSLPEKIAPITAGNILTESVLSIIAERNTDG